MSARDVAIVAGIALVCGALVGAFGYAAWDTRRDARIEAEANARLAELRAEREAARNRTAEVERERDAARRQIEADSVAREQERRELRDVADRARIRGDSLAREIVDLFPETEAMVAELREEGRREVAAERRRTEVAEEEVRALRAAGFQDARLIETLRGEVATADARAEAAARSEVAARQAAASRERWYKVGGGALLLVILAAAASSS